MAPLAPSRPLVGAQSGAYPEFPDSLWKGYSPKFATCKQRPSYGKDSHVAYVSPLASLLLCPRSMHRAEGHSLALHPQQQKPVVDLIKEGVQLSSHRKIALVTGILFVITFITAIPPVFVFYVPVLDDPRYIVGAGADNSVALGAFLELILIIANIGTAVVLYPVVKRQNEILALGYVTARVVECTFIAVGILSLLSIVTLRQEAAGGDAASLVTAGKSLVALHDWTFLIGPGFFVGVGNGLMLGYLMYRSALVPRGMAMLGLIGGPLVIASGVAILFGVIEAGGVWQGISTIPEFFWELSLGIWLIVRGFNPSAIARLQDDSQ